MKVTTTVRNAVLAGVASLAVGIGGAAVIGHAESGASAAVTRPQSDHALLAAVVNGATFGIDSVTYRARPIRPAPIVSYSCASQLAAIREVSWSGRILLGASTVRHFNAGAGPAWSRVLRSAGLDHDARDAAELGAPKSARRYVRDLTTTAAAVLHHANGCRA
jgi:hypothetical protein